MSEGRAGYKDIVAGLEKAQQIKDQRKALGLQEVPRKSTDLQSGNKKIEVVHALSLGDIDDALDVAESGYKEYQEKEESVN